MPPFVTAFRAAAFATLIICAAVLAAQQPVPAPPGTTGPVPPPATQTPQQPPPGQPAPAKPVPGQTTPGPQEPAQTTPQAGRVLTGDAGVIFFPVKPERAADFEKIVAKVKEAFETTEDPVRKQQIAGWKVFKAIEPGPNNSTLYVFIIDPAVKGSDYAFWKTMYEAFPAEVQELYRLYTAATAGSQTLLNLQLVQALGAPSAPPPPQR